MIYPYHVVILQTNCVRTLLCMLFQMYLSVHKLLQQYPKIPFTVSKMKDISILRYRYQDYLCNDKTYQSVHPVIMKIYYEV